MIMGIKLQFVKLLDRNVHPKRIASMLLLLNNLLLLMGSVMFTLITGVIGFMIVAELNVFDALYMTIITISTVGYGELFELSTKGRVFASIFIVTNIGIFAYAVGGIANLIVEGKLRKILKDLFIGRKIDKMKNHIIICGYGRYGRSVYHNLKDLDYEIVMIEKNPETVEALRAEADMIVIDGDAVDEYTLKEAGIEHAKAIITTLPDDASNVYATLSARILNPSITIISRANVASSEHNLMKAGANHVLVPENIGGMYMASLVSKPLIVHVLEDLLTVSNDQLRIVQLDFEEIPHEFVSKSVADLELETKFGVKVIGVKQRHKEMIYNPTTAIPMMNHMIILVIGREDQISNLQSIASSYNFSIL